MQNWIQKNIHFLSNSLSLAVSSAWKKSSDANSATQHGYKMDAVATPPQAKETSQQKVVERIIWIPRVLKIGMTVLSYSCHLLQLGCWWHLLRILALGIFCIKAGAVCVHNDIHSVSAQRTLLMLLSVQRGLESSYYNMKDGRKQRWLSYAQKEDYNFGERDKTRRVTSWESESCNEHLTASAVFLYHVSCVRHWWTEFPRPDNEHRAAFLYPGALERLQVHVSYVNLSN